jgi:hypothetical protein
VKYTLSYKTKFGTLTAESNNPDDLVIGYQTLKNLVSQLNFAESKEKIKKRPTSEVSYSVSAAKRVRGSRGHGETARIIRELESKILSTAFFSKPKTTGETRDKLIEVSGRKFKSRKVSQALGILWKKGVLKRSGTRNYFSYSK